MFYAAKILKQNKVFFRSVKYGRRVQKCMRMITICYVNVGRFCGFRFLSFIFQKTKTDGVAGHEEKKENYCIREIRGAAEFVF